MQQLAISNVTVQTDESGRYCLNDLHAASGGEQRHRPKYFLENQQTQDLIKEIVDTEGGIPPSVTLKGGAGVQGTFVAKPLVYAYAMWVSPRFHLQVIRAYDSLVNPNPADPPLISLDVGNLNKAHKESLELARNSGAKGDNLYLLADRLTYNRTGQSPFELLGVRPAQKPQPEPEKWLTFEEVAKLADVATVMATSHLRGMGFYVKDDFGMSVTQTGELYGKTFGRNVYWRPEVAQVLHDYLASHVQFTFWVSNGK